MKFTVATKPLLKALQVVIGAIEHRQTMQILANVLFTINEQQLLIIATDTEIELISAVPLKQKIKMPSFTVPGRKLLDICRTVPEDSESEFLFDQEHERVIVTIGLSRFTLATLPAAGFPNIPEQTSIVQFTTQQKNLKTLTEKTHFAIPQQSARHYLLGMFLEVKDGVVTAAASDGHRLALYSIKTTTDKKAFAQIIIPRKGVIELMRLLENSEEEISVALNENYIRIIGRTFVYTSKLIVGKFPNYAKLIPQGNDKIIVLDRDQLKQAIIRVSILSNEIFRNIRLQLQRDSLRLITNNPEQEEAVEDLAVTYSGEKFEAIFNVNYFVDILNSLETPKVRVLLKNNESGALVEEVNGQNECTYVLMPIRK